MRTHLFTFKKTKRVKTVTEYPAISVDLTKDEAKELMEIIARATVESEEPGTLAEEAMAALYDALEAFVK
jgi:general stress protein 26